MIKKMAVMLLCLVLILGCCAPAFAENQKTDQPDQTDEESIIRMLKRLLENTAEMTDEELREEIIRISEKANYNITEKQIDRALEICRSLEGMDEEELRAWVDSFTEKLKKGLVDVPEQFMGWLEDIENGDYTWDDAKSDLFSGLSTGADSLSGFFGGVADFFSGLAGGEKVG